MTQNNALPPSIAGARELVDPALRKAIDRLDVDCRKVAAYHFGWIDPHGAPTGSSGKAIRPAMALLSAQVAGGTADQAISGAVAVELIHNFSLLHDDLMDGDRERRHRATAWTVFGSSPALLTGDGLLTLAGEILLEDPAPGAVTAARSLLAATNRLVAGQAADLSFERRLDVDLDECLHMVTGKTASLLSCSTAIGAELLAAPSEVVEGLRTFGAELGIAFQLVDDLLGLWGDPSVTGKPVLADLRARKQTIPVVHALMSRTPHTDRLRELYGQQDPLSEPQLQDAAEIIERAGSREWTVAEGRRRLDSALNALRSAAPAGTARDALVELAEFIVRREL